jgi:GTP-binding protein
LNRFVDETTITVRSGKGGDGCVSFRREKYVPKGGPDGGDGGRGGNVVFRVDPSLKTLVHLASRKKLKAGNGEQGGGQGRHGKAGENVVIHVPSGTLIRDAESGELLADLHDNVSEYTVLYGGRGGKGNTHFKSATQRTPRYAESGDFGDERRVLLELRVLADCGLVGPPNAGKSSLLRALTAAHPEVASYPFTTKGPRLGVIHYETEDLVLADIPGIIEGASGGAGLGLRFLRHVSRTRALLILVDLERNDPEEQYRYVLQELEAYDPSLCEKERIILGSKSDLPESRERLKRLLDVAIGERVMGISSEDGTGIAELRSALRDVAAPGAAADRGVAGTGSETRARTQSTTGIDGGQGEAET